MNLFLKKYLCVCVCVYPCTTQVTRIHKQKTLNQQVSNCVWNHFHSNFFLSINSVCFCPCAQLKLSQVLYLVCVKKKKEYYCVLLLQQQQNILAHVGHEIRTIKLHVKNNFFFS